MRTAPQLALALLVLGAVAWSTALFFGFTAEDTYILYRYVENLHHFGELTYNRGERINALTSPLHALLLAALATLPADVATLNTALGAGAALAAALALAWQFRADPLIAILAVALLLGTSCVPLWTFGGLETPLLLALVTVTVLLGLRPHRRAHAYAICVLAGLGFLARFDAALFFAPLALAALVREPSWRHRLLAAAAGAFAPLAWLGAAFGYYGDILPTSFYLKTPGFAVDTVIENAYYVGGWLLLCGLAPAALLALLLGGPGTRDGAFLARHGATLAGLALQLAYALAIATTHMMFSFRCFVPYLPAAIVVIGAALRAPAPLAGTPARVVGAFVAAITLFGAWHAWYTYTRSVNGLSPVGEFRQIGSRDFMRVFMQALDDQAAAIRRDWARRHPARERAPRVSTYAGGLVPYRLRDSYVYEALASYRHGAPRYRNFSRNADYVMSVYPFFGPMEDQLPGGLGRYELVFERSFPLHGAMQAFRVYYNPDPEPHPLGDRIDRPRPAAQR